MNKSDDISLLAAALVNAQPMVDGAKKGSVNPHFRSKYADLGSVWDAVSEALEKNDLAISQYPDETSQGLPALTTMLIHQSGQWIGATYPLISVKQDPQGFASAQTYARRYGLAAVMGVISEDDDGQAASKPSKAPTAVPQAQTPAKPTVAAEAYAPASVTGPEPAMTPKRWLEIGIDRVKGLDSKGLDEFTEKYHAKIAKLRPLEPALHAKLMDAIKDRQGALC